jgi:hypothetical protein
VQEEVLGPECCPMGLWQLGEDLGFETSHNVLAT